MNPYRAVICAGGLLLMLACRLATAAPTPTPTGQVVSPTYRALPTATETPPPPEPEPTIVQPTKAAPLASQVPRSILPFEAVSSVGDVLTPVAEISGVVAGADRWLHADPTGTLWYLTDRGAAEFSEGAWRVRLDGVERQLVGRDNAGRLWYASKDGADIAAWSEGIWITYTMADGWRPLPASFYQPVCRGLAADGDGRIWLQTVQDVRLFDGRVWRVIPHEEMEMNPADDEGLLGSFEVVPVGRGSEVWVGECDWGGPGPFGGEGVRWFDGMAWRRVGGLLDRACVTVITEAADGAIWIGADSGLWRYDRTEGTWQSYPLPAPPDGFTRYGFVEAMLVDATGQVWTLLAPCGGASCYAGYVPYLLSGNEWAQLAPLDGQYIPWLLRSADGGGWLGFAGAVYRIEGGTVSLVTRLIATQATVDESSRLWMIASADDGDWLYMVEP